MSNFQSVLGGYKSQQATQLIIQASRMALAALWSSVMVSKTKFDQKQLVFDSEMFLPWDSHQTPSEALLNPWLHVFSKQRHIGVANHIHIYPFQKKHTVCCEQFWTQEGVIIFQVPPSLQVRPGVTFNLETLAAPGDLQCPKPKTFNIFRLTFFAKLRNRQLLIFDLIGSHVWLVSKMKSEKEPKLPNWFCFWCRCFFVGLFIQKAAAEFLGDLVQLVGKMGTMGVSNWRTQFHLVRVDILHWLSVTTYPYTPCMVYLPTWMVDFYGKCSYKYTSPMDIYRIVLGRSPRGHPNLFLEDAGRNINFWGVSSHPSIWSEVSIILLEEIR